MEFEMTLSPEMRELLASTKNKTFKSYLCAGFGSPGSMNAYGNLRINLGSYALDLSCFQSSFDSFLGTPEEVAVLACERMESDSSFRPGVISEPMSYLVGERITGVELVRDEVRITGSGTDDTINVDVAVVLRTAFAVYTFSRHIWFSEDIAIRVRDAPDIPYTPERCAADWTDDPEEGDAVAAVTRTVERLA